MGTPPKLAESADHHYVPKFYLKGFTDTNGSLWVYEKGRTVPRESKPKKEGNQENYYTFTDRGHTDDRVEKMLSKAESAVAPVIRKLANPQFRMTEAQEDELFTFIALSFVRVPAYREFIDRHASALLTRISQEQARDPEKFFAILRKYESDTGEPLGDHEKLREFAVGNNYTVAQRSVGFNLSIAFEAALTITEYLETEYKYDIFYAPAEVPFVTCDNPIVTIEPSPDGMATVGVGFGRRGTQVIFPLNKRACIVLSRTGKREQKAAPLFRIQRINDMMMGVAQKSVYASVCNRRLTRIFNERGCKIKYGVNAFLP